MLPESRSLRDRAPSPCGPRPLFVKMLLGDPVPWLLLNSSFHEAAFPCRGLFGRPAADGSRRDIPFSPPAAGQAPGTHRGGRSSPASSAQALPGASHGLAPLLLPEPPGAVPPDSSPTARDAEAQAWVSEQGSPDGSPVCPPWSHLGAALSFTHADARLRGWG